MTALDLFGPASADGAVSVRPGETRSFGTADTFFRDCSSPDLDDGTEYQAALFNQWLANIRSIARVNGQTGAGVDIVTPDNADDAILLKAILHLVQRNQPNYAVDQGTADALVASPSPAFAEYKAGMRLIVKKSAADNATTAPVINVSGLGNIPIVDRRGNALAKGDLPANAFLDLKFDGTSARMMGVVSADIGKLKSLTNVKQFATSTRVAMHGAAGNSYTVTAWSGLTYTKKSPTSNLMLWFSAPTLSSGPAEAGCGSMVLSIGANTVTMLCANNTPAEGRGQTNAVEQMTGIAAGDLALSLVCTRADAIVWDTIFCPQTSDSSWLPAASFASLVIGELEP